MKLIDQIVYRWRLRMICRRLDIRPYPWQRAYVLGKSDSLPVFRRSGTTTAVILYGLVRKIRYQDDIYRLAWQRDPACRCRDPLETRCRQEWFYREYIGTALRAGLHKRPDGKGVNMR